jgi:hypothetical protein
MAGRSSTVVRFCATADSEVAATSIAANVSDFANATGAFYTMTMFNLPWGVPAPTRG